MFDRLPPELVRQIIESAIPSTSLSSNYAERQSNLQAFCFVCRYLRTVAQPLLFASVSARKSPRTLNEALITVQSKAEHSSKRWTSSRFERLARNGQGLRVLTLAYLEETVNIALLTQLPQLRDLRLFGNSFKINSRFVLPRLESLTMDLDSLDTLLPRLRPASLPALRNFAIPYSTETRRGRLSELLKDTSFRHLVDQVDTFFIDSRLIESSALNDFQPLFRKTLVSVDRDDHTFCCRLSPRSHHARIRSFDHFVVFARIIYGHETIDLPLRSLYLDAVDRHKTIPVIQSGMLRKRTVNELFPGVEIVYEERGGDSPFESIISEGFVARQRRRNAGEELK